MVVVEAGFPIEFIFLFDLVKVLDLEPGQDRLKLDEQAIVLSLHRILQQLGPPFFCFGDLDGACFLVHQLAMSR